jgi:two-component system chemotaxis sensor kinase CheA
VDRAHRLQELFRSEARERLAQLSAGALRVERGDSGPELIAALFRAAHTVKGGARMLGLDAVSEAAERVEQALAPHRTGQPPTSLGTELLRLVDQLRDAIWPPSPTSSAATGPSVRPTVENPRPTIRVQPDRIDALLGLVAEATRAADRLSPGPGGTPAAAQVRDLAGLVAAAEAAALRLRLLPMGAMFDDLRRAVRDAAAADGKQAELVAIGGDVEADTTVVDAAAEIVLQLVRNAVAHGLERPGERAAAGKPTVGRVEVALRQTGGWVELRVADDGRGVDEAAVRRRAAALGYREAAAAELVFLPGLSTRERADDLGGRGIGLDIVRARARAVGGDVRVTWKVGVGTTFLARLPVSALYERLIVGSVGGALVGVPVDAVAEVVVGSSDAALPFDGAPMELSVLTVPLGPLFAPSRFTNRGWIAPDGRIGVVLSLRSRSAWLGARS